jgi:RHS repeat-associated protein
LLPLLRSTGVYPGLLKYVENPADKRSYRGYNDRGQTTRTWGHVPNPTENVYDSYGQRTTLKTFRGGTGWDGSTWPESPGDSDDAAWTLHEATGLLNQKTYDDSTSVVYTYTSDGKLYTRKWARNAADGKVTTYGYDPNTGELTSVDYDAAWNMTDLAYTYDRLGRRATVTDAAGTRSFACNSTTLLPATETYDENGMFGAKVITQVYQDGSGGTLAGRWAGVQVGTANDPDADHAAAYGFDAYGRLNHVTGPGLPTGDGTNNGAWYSFVSGSELVDQLLFKNSSATVKAWVDWSYEDERDLVTAVESSFGDLTTYTTISKYAYGNDSRGRREHVVRTGSAFASSHMDLWQHNDRNELTRSERHAGTDPNSPGAEDTALRRVYAYDPIGNRSTSTEGTGAQTTYTSNNLNQYDPVVTATSPQTGQRLKYDLDGNLTEAFVTGDLDGDGQVGQSDLGILMAAYGKCQGESGYNAAANLSDASMCSSDPNLPVIDQADLGLLLSVYGLQATGAIRAKFTWDAENRLVGWEPLLFVSGAKKVEFKYDYLGRRIEKKVHQWTLSDPNDPNTGAWQPHETRRFIWNNWLLLLELDSDGNVLRKLTWGRDLSGSLDGAGGIGGLLAIQDANGTTTGENHETDDLRYVYFYDANGNVGQVIDLAAPSASASIKAHYEYDAYGNLLVQSGSYAAANPYRFSTKPWDDETGLGYWGYRYYDPRLGRWISRDPIEELGGAHLYSYVHNRPASLFDAHGQYCTSSVCAAPQTPPPPAPSPCPILDNPFGPCRLNPMCWCIMLFGPPPRDTVWGFDGNLLIGAVYR